MSKDVRVDQESRRKFVKTVAYVAPTIVTLSAVPSFASAGSGYSRCENKTQYSGEENNFKFRRY